MATDVNDKFRPEKRALIASIDKMIRIILCNENGIQ